MTRSKLTNMRVFFGHQSVGKNIIEGIRAISISGQKLKIIETRQYNNQKGPCLFHAPIGKNQDPLSKIQDFVVLMKNSYGDKVDIAGFKFCYIDIDRSTDVEHIFSEYHNAMSALEAQFSQTRFLHVTAPLRTVEPNTRLLIKRFLGKKSIALADNKNRQAFNELMIETYMGKQPVFDLARAESTRPSGKRMSHSFEGNLVYSLIPEYTDDGGHLNKLGRQIIAQQFVDCIEQIN